MRRGNQRNPPAHTAPDSVRRGRCLESGVTVHIPSSGPRLRQPLDLSELNPEQLAAVRHLEGPLLVFAGAGSGKTRVITHRVANLVASGVAPWNILAVTFTNKAADEMRERIVKLVGHAAGGINVGTFHGQCLRILRRDIHRLDWEPAFTIYDATDQLRAVKQSMSDLDIPLNSVSPLAIRNEISRAKDELASPYEYAERSEGNFQELTAKVYHRYQVILRNAGAVDFGDMIAFTVRILREHPEARAYYQDRFRFVLVDEYQDTNRAQYYFVRELVGAHHNLCVVGDDDQSIYSWRGADVRNILDFEQQFASAAVVRLERNYRSTKRVLAASNALVSRLATRAPKKLWTERDEGPPINVIEAFDEDDEAQQVLQALRQLKETHGLPRDEIAVMYRTNAQSRSFEELFVRLGVPYQLIGATEFYGRKEVRDVLAYLRAVANPRDLVSFERIANVPRRGLGAVSLKKLREWSERTGRAPGEMTRWIARQADHPEGDLSAAPFSTRPLRVLRDLGRLLLRLDGLAAELPVSKLITALVQESGYDEVLDSDPEKPEERWENVVELATAASKYDSLGPRESVFRYLSEAALVSETDNLTYGTDAVTLLTFHAAKGLEFGAVFMVGMEEELFPHIRSYEDPQQMEEERRLAYVGVTRAKDHLFLSYTRHRSGWGAPVRFPSRFLQDIPSDLLCYKRQLDAQPGIPSVGLAALTTPDATPPPAERAFRDGQRVRHPTFGDGLVVAGKLTANDEEITVMFESAGLKRLAVSFARLEALN